MNLDDFQAKYTSATLDGKTITLSGSDYTQLLEDIDTVAPENVVAFYYQGYAINNADAHPSSVSSNTTDTQDTDTLSTKSKG